MKLWCRYSAGCETLLAAASASGAAAVACIARQVINTFAAACCMAMGLRCMQARGKISYVAASVISSCMPTVLM